MGLLFREEQICCCDFSGFSFLIYTALFNYLLTLSDNFYMVQDDPKVHTVVEKLLDVLNTPSEAVQRAVSDCLSPLMASKQVIIMLLTVAMQYSLVSVILAPHFRDEDIFHSASYYYQEDGQALVSRLLDRLMRCDKYGERRGAAFGLAGAVKGFGISCLKKYGIVTALHDGLQDRFATSL